MSQNMEDIPLQKKNKRYLYKTECPAIAQKSNFRVEHAVRVMLFHPCITKKLLSMSLHGLYL